MIIEYIEDIVTCYQGKVYTGRCASLPVHLCTADWGTQVSVFMRGKVKTKNTHNPNTDIYEISRSCTMGMVCVVTLTSATRHDIQYIRIDMLL